MTKLVLSSVASGFDLSKINDNFTKIATEINNKLLYRDNPVGEPNSLVTDVDTNGKRIYNLPTPVGNGDAVPKKWLEDNFDPVTNAAAQAATASAAAALASQNSAASSASGASISAASALTSANNAASSEANAALSASNAATSASQAAVYSSLGLGAAAGFDFGSITDAVIIFPTDFGTIV